MATDYTITNLDSRLKNYLDANGAEVLAKTLFTTDNAKYFTIQTGVTAEKPIIRLDSSITIGDGTSCGFDAEGEDVFTNRTLNPEFLKVNKEFCPKTLLKTWAHSDVKMNALGQQEEMPFEQLLINTNLDAVANVNARLAWEGDKTNGTGNMAKMNGIITIATADANTIKQTKGTDTVWERTQKIWLSIDPAIADKCTIFMSVANYKKLIVELMNANMYHIFEEYAGEYRMKMPGANVDIVGVSGIQSDKIVATPVDNLFLGVDAENDSDTVDLFYDKSDRDFKMVIEYAYCVNYAFSEWVYINA